MNLRILALPFSIIIAIILFVFYVKPEFESMKNLDLAKDCTNQQLDSISTKEVNITAMKNFLKSNDGKAGIVRKYLPSESSEEKVINGIYELAKNSSVIISSIDVVVANEKSDSSKEQTSTQATGSATQVSGQSGDACVDFAMMSGNDELALELGINNVAKKDVNKKIVSVNVEFIGNYNNLKQAVNKVYKSDKLNKIRNIEIGRDGDDDNPNLLSLKMDADFYFMDKQKLTEGDTASPIFLGNSLDFSVADQITKMTSNVISDVQSKKEGKSNPFLP